MLLTSAYAEETLAPIIGQEKATLYISLSQVIESALRDKGLGHFLPSVFFPALAIVHAAMLRNINEAINRPDAPDTNKQAQATLHEVETIVQALVTSPMNASDDAMQELLKALRG